MRRFLVLVLAAATLAVPQSADAVTPPPVTDLTAFQLDGPVHLQWTTPPGTDGLTAAYAAGPQAPGTPTDGTAITLSNPQAHAATVRGLTAATIYSVAVWTKTGDTYSAPATTTFTTRPSGPTDPIGKNTVTVTVTDTTGHRLAGARADTYRAATYDYRTATTGTDGTATLHLPDGEYEIGAAGGIGGTSDATGYAYRDVTRAITGDTHVTLQLRAGGAVTGRITDAAGRPLKNTKVDLFPPDPYVSADQGFGVSVMYAFDETPQTDATGRFVVRNKSGAGAVPCFTHPGYVRRCADEAVAPGPGVTRSIGTLALARVSAATATLTGTVTGQDGRPIDKVDLDVEGRNDYSFVQADARGGYRVALAPGRWRVCADPYAPGGLGYLRVCRTVTITRATTTRLDFRLPFGAAVSGRVLAPTGAGAPHVQVDAEPAGSRGGPGASASADADGFFTVGGLRTGRYRLCFEGDRSASAGDPTGVTGPCIVRWIKVGRDRLGADVTLRPAAAITGIVTGADGRPLPGASVLLEQRMGSGGGYAQTDRTGRYSIIDVAPGTYRFCVDLGPSLYQMVERCRSASVTTTGGSTTTVDFTYPALPTITVTVTDRAGHRLSNVEVAALRSCTSYYCNRQPLLGRKAQVDAGDYTDAHGRITLIGARTGHYAVCAFAYYAATPATAARTGYADKCTGRAFDLTVTKTAPTTVRLKLARGGAITGRVTDTHGRPLAGVRVHLPGSPVDDTDSADADFTDAPSPYIDSVTDAHGRYTIHSIRPGRGTLCGGRTCLATKATIRPGIVTHAPTLVVQPGTATRSARAAVRSGAHRPTVRMTVRDGRVVRIER